MTPDDRPTQRGSGIVALLVVTVLILPLVYVASIGPVARLVPDPPDWLEALYFPILWPAREFEAVGEWLKWYLSLWGAH